MKNGRILLFLLCLALAAVGAILRFVFIGYSFGAYFLFAVALVLLPFVFFPSHGGFLVTKIIIMIIAIIVAAAFAVSLYNVIIYAKTDKDIPDETPAVVLGAAVNGTAPSQSLNERLCAAYDYLTSHPASVAVLSGGQGAGEDISEGEAMYRYLTERGIDSDRLIIENRATNTDENIKYSLELLADRNKGEKPDKITVISSEYHLYRAYLITRDCGIDSVYCHAAETSGLPLRINYFLREGFGIMYYKVFE